MFENLTKMCLEDTKQSLLNFICDEILKGFIKVGATEKIIKKVSLLIEELIKEKSDLSHRLQNCSSKYCQIQKIT